MSTKGRAWLWLGILANGLLLLPAFYMAISAFAVAMDSGGSGIAFAIAALFFALPVFCIWAPLSAWRMFPTTGFSAHVGFLLVAPFAYAAFLAAFLLTG